MPHDKNRGVIFILNKPTKPKTDNMAYVYRHIRLDTNQPFYIGIGSDEKNKRAVSKKNRNIHWRRIVSKAEYKVEIILDNLTWEQACQKEFEFINIYGRSDLKKGILCNLTDGGDGVVGFIVSDEIRKKRSESYKGDKFKGIKNPFYGKKHSEETRIKISKYKKGNTYSVGLKRSEQFKKKISVNKKGNKNMLGKKHSLESKKKMSESAKGRISWNKGKTGIYSKETLIKMSESGKGRPAWNKGIPQTEKVKMKISKALKGKSATWNIGNSYCKGKSHSQLTKDKISQKKMGNKHSLESRLKMSKSHKGIPLSKTHVEKIKIAVRKLLESKK